jgi:hypothetical protein
MPRQDTQLESEGAEFLVLGQLLIEGIPAYKTYTNLRGYDLVATWPETNRSARIQVKSRWATNAKQFLIKEIDCDFVVLVRLNRGYRFAAAEKMTLPPQDPEFYVLAGPKHSLLIMKRVGPKFVGWSSALSPIGESGAQSETSSRFQ